MKKIEYLLFELNKFYPLLSLMSRWQAFTLVTGGNRNFDWISLLEFVRLVETTASVLRVHSIHKLDESERRGGPEDSVNKVNK